jgi:cytochrome c-type biogenesis protein CcmH
MMQRALLLSALLLWAPQQIATPPAAGTPAPYDEQLEARVREVASQLRCPVCQGLSIQDSPAELAQDMRAVVRDMLAQGKTPEEVKAYFVQSYGEWVLLEPKARGFNLLLYLLPAVAVLGGVLLIYMLTKRWTGKGEPPQTIAADDPDLEPYA